MMRISVYGSTGFIGSVFSKKYSSEVLRIDREARKPKSKDILYLISTTTNYNVYESLTMDVNINLVVLMEVLEECKDKGITFNYISTGFVYGTDIIDADEEDYCEPKGFYSITKRTAEMLIISFCETFGVNYRILRLANVYGTEDSENSGKKNALGYLIEQLKQNKEISLYDGGDVLRDYMHIDDICSAIKLVIENGKLNSIYNIASGKPMRFIDIILYAKDYIQSESSIILTEAPEFYKKVQAKNFTLDTKKLKLLGFQEKLTIHEGIKLLCR